MVVVIIIDTNFDSTSSRLAELVEIDVIKFPNFEWYLWTNDKLLPFAEERCIFLKHAWIMDKRRET